jgi:hypothetical protein
MKSILQQTAVWLSAFSGTAAVLVGCSGAVVGGTPPGYGEPQQGTGNGATCSWPVPVYRGVPNGQEETAPAPLPGKAPAGIAPKCANLPAPGGVATKCDPGPAVPSYKVGDSVPAQDSCNACVCTEKGIACTQNKCAAPEYCIVDGVQHQVGERWSDEVAVPLPVQTEPVPQIPVMDPSPPAPSGMRICAPGNTSSSGGTSSGATSSGSSGYVNNGYCTCQAGGSVVCTGSGGVAKPSTGSGGGATSGGTADRAAPVAPNCVCLEGKVEHPVFSSFPSSDGCNTCSCQPDGIICTAAACAATDAGPAPDAGVDSGK